MITIIIGMTKRTMMITTTVRIMMTKMMIKITMMTMMIMLMTMTMMMTIMMMMMTIRKAIKELLSTTSHAEDYFIHQIVIPLLIFIFFLMASS